MKKYRFAAPIFALLFSVAGMQPGFARQHARQRAHTPQNMKAVSGVPEERGMPTQGMPGGNKGLEFGR